MNLVIFSPNLDVLIEVLRLHDQADTKLTVVIWCPMFDGQFIAPSSCDFRQQSPKYSIKISPPVVLYLWFCRCAPHCSALHCTAQLYGPILKLTGLVHWISTIGEIGCTTQI